MQEKMEDPEFTNDMHSLLRPGISFNASDAYFYKKSLSMIPYDMIASFAILVILGYILVTSNTDDEMKHLSNAIRKYLINRFFFDKNQSE